MHYCPVMAVVRAQVVLPFIGGKPRDIITNQFHFDANEAAPRDLIVTQIAARLNDFYETIYPGSVRTNYVTWNMAVVKIYWLEDAVPRPLYEESLGIINGAVVSNLPTEVAMVASWYSAQVPGIPRQSSYNRIYLGALVGADMTPSTITAFPTLSTAAVGRANTAMQNLLEPDVANPDIEWKQYGATGIGRIPVLRTITGGFTDNSPDTQRRRSVDATAKTNWAPLEE